LHRWQVSRLHWHRPPLPPLLLLLLLLLLRMPS
jgi:hypothetical protein